MSASVKLNAKLIDSFNRNNAVVYKLVTKQWLETIFVKEKNFAADAVVYVFIAAVVLTILNIILRIFKPKKKK